MTAMRNEAIAYINKMPEEKIENAVNYLRLLHEKRNPAEASGIEEVYERIEAGLEDFKHGRSRPFEEVMGEIIGGLL
ncbi:MAG: hypothetical protein FWG87_15160 [Defluviitaleaceae bacterium]|nr:hypothetical protein [Defluviitaleaceae bacterium]